MRLPAATAFSLQRTEATPRARIEEAARGLESQFAQMLIKSMRSASPGDPFGDWRMSAVEVTAGSCAAFRLASRKVPPLSIWPRISPVPWAVVWTLK